MERHVKKFSVNEYCSWILSQGSPHNIVISVKLNGIVNSFKIKDALKLAALKQNITTRSITKNHCHFVNSKKPMEIHEVKNRRIKLIIEKELKKPFPDYSTLIRATLLNNKKEKYIIICFHHIVSDGVSGLHFIKSALNYYNKKNTTPVFCIPIRSIIPRPRPFLTNKPALKPCNSTKIHSIHIDEKTIENIERNVKNTTCSIYVFLIDKISKAASAALKIEKPSIITPIDLRNEIEKKQPALSFKTSWINFKGNQYKKNCAGKIKSHIKKLILKKIHIENLKKLSRKIENRKTDWIFSKSFISKKPVIFISNLMKTTQFVFSSKEWKNLNPSEIHIFVNTQAYLDNKNSTAIQLIRLKEKGVFIDISYSSPVVSDKKIKALSRKIKNILSF